MRNTTMTALTVAAVLAAGTLVDTPIANADPLAFTPGTGTMVLAEATHDGHGVIQLSDDGFKAIRDVSMARLAIFEGAPKEAEKLLGQAKSSLNDASKLADKLVHKGKSSPGVTYIPIDARLTVADDLVYTPENADRLAKLDEHLKKGENTQAIEVLRAGGVLVNVTMALLPVEATQKAIDKASKLVADGKYYEANLALKTAEEGILIDSESLLEVLKAQPAAGKQG